MMNWKLLAAIAIACCTLVGVHPAAAHQVIGTEVYGSVAGVHYDVRRIHGAVITPPSNEPLTRFSLWFGRNSGASTFTAQGVIYEWNGSTTVGPALWSSPQPIDVPDQAMTEHVFLPDIVLDPAKQYLLAITAVVPGNDDGGVFEAGPVPGNDPNGQYVMYYANLGSWQTNLTGYKAHYSATFGTPVAVPTLTEWAMILLGLMLAAGAVTAIQRRSVLARA